MNRLKFLKTSRFRTPSKVIDDKSLDARIIRGLNERLLEVYASRSHGADDSVLATEGVGESRDCVVRT